MTINRAARRRGFTLLEAMVTLAIGSVALLIVANLIDQALRANDAVSRMDVELRGVTALSNLMRRDIGSLCGDPATTRLLSGDNDGDAPRLRIVSSRIHQDEGTSRQTAKIIPSTVIYTTHKEPDGSITFLRGELPSDTMPRKSRPISIPVARGLSKVEIAYFDGSDWQNVWKRNTPPRGISVHLAPMDHLSPNEGFQNGMEDITFHISPMPGGAQ